MTGLYDTYGTDAELEVSGIWLDYGLNAKKQKIRFRVARAGGANSRFNKMIEVSTRPYRTQIQDDNLPAEISDPIVLEAFASTVILGWEGVTDKKGKDLEFTKENVIKLFTDLPDLWTDVRTQAAKMSNYLAAQTKADLGN